MEATLKFTQKLAELNKFWFEKKMRDLEEKLRVENENLLKRLGLDKMFENSKNKNSLFKLLNNSDVNDGDNGLGKKEIMKNVSKTNEMYNKTFDAMDNGKIKPLLLKIFDNVKDKIKDSVKDNAKDSFEDFLGAKHDEAKKVGIKEISNNINEIEKDIKEKEDNDSVEVENSNTNSNTSKSKSYERQRLRYR